MVGGIEAQIHDSWVLKIPDHCFLQFFYLQQTKVVLFFLMQSNRRTLK